MVPRADLILFLWCWSCDSAPPVTEPAVADEPAPPSTDNEGQSRWLIASTAPVSFVASKTAKAAEPGSLITMPTDVTKCKKAKTRQLGTSDASGAMVMDFRSPGGLVLWRENASDADVVVQRISTGGQRAGKPARLALATVELRQLMAAGRGYVLHYGLANQPTQGSLLYLDHIGRPLAPPVSFQIRRRKHDVVSKLASTVNINLVMRKGRAFLRGYFETDFEGEVRLDPFGLSIQDTDKSFYGSGTLAGDIEARVNHKREDKVLRFLIIETGGNRKTNWVDLDADLGIAEPLANAKRVTGPSGDQMVLLEGPTAIGNAFGHNKRRFRAAWSGRSFFIPAVVKRGRRYRATLFSVTCR